MTAEIEPGKFRRGENAQKPYGGNIAETPFTQALYRIAKSRGYETQMDLSRALAKKRNYPVSSWYRGKDLPNPEHFGALIVILRPNDVELDDLVNPYLEHLRAESFKDSRKNLARARSQKSRATWQFFTDFCLKNRTTFPEISHLLSIPLLNIDYGMARLAEILEKAPKALKLDRQDTASLAEAVAQEIEKRIAEGKKTRGLIATTRIKQKQKELVCKTYMGPEAALVLSVTRERVRQLRRDYGLPLLLTEDQLELLKNRQKSRLGRPRKAAEV